MGVVVKQSLLNSLWMYLGVVLGYVNLIILFPRLLEGEELGLVQLLLAVGVIFANLGQLGGKNIIVRYFPYFKDWERQHRGLIFFCLLLVILGTTVTAGLLYLFRDPVVDFYSEKSGLFVEYYYYLIPVVFLVSIFEVFASYIMALKRTVHASFAREFLRRIVELGLVVLYFLKVIDLELFILLYASTFLLLLLYLIAILMRDKQFLIKPNFDWSGLPKMKDILTYGAFNMFSGITSALTVNIDRIMIAAMVFVPALGEDSGLVAVAIYSIAAALASAIVVPYRSLMNVSVATISEAWKNQDLKTIKSYYKKSSISMLVIGGLLFIGVWGNIDGLFAMLPADKGYNDFEGAQLVVLYLGLGRLFDMASGINTNILNYSKYYRFAFLNTIALLGLTIGLNLWLIPEQGLVGAAIATALSLLIVNLSKLFFILIVMKMQPFTWKSILIVALGFAVWWISTFIPELGDRHIWWLNLLDMAVRSLIICVLFIPPVLLMKVSPELNAVWNKVLQILRLRRA